MEHELLQETEPEPVQLPDPLDDYHLAGDRVRREIRPPLRYSEPDFITTLNV